MDHLDRLESEAIYIMREVTAECERPVMLYSIGKDSSVMLHIAKKAFYPERPPFPFLHIDTTWKFREMIDHNPECASCGHTDVCRGGCRARAATDLYDDYLRPEPITCEFFKGEWRDKIHEACVAAFDAYRHRRGIS